MEQLQHYLEVLKNFRIYREEKLNFFCKLRSSPSLSPSLFPIIKHESLPTQIPTQYSNNVPSILNQNTTLYPSLHPTIYHFLDVLKNLRIYREEKLKLFCKLKFNPSLSPSLFPIIKHESLPTQIPTQYSNNVPSILNQNITSYPSLYPTIYQSIKPFKKYISNQGYLYFKENFTNGLIDWTGKNGEMHHGMIVNDPLGLGDKALLFTKTNQGGDMFSSYIETSPTKNYIISFDYLGKPIDTVISNNLGCSMSLGEINGLKVLVAAAWNYDLEIPNKDNYYVVLEDDKTWHHYLIPFYYDKSEFRLILEDWNFDQKVPARAGDCYFKNIVISDGNTEYDTPSKQLSSHPSTLPTALTQSPTSIINDYPSCNERFECVEKSFKSEICKRGDLIFPPKSMDVDGDGTNDWICEYKDGTIEICYSDGLNVLFCEIIGAHYSE